MRSLKSGRQLGQVEVHPGLERLHAAAGHQRAEVAEHHAGEQVQRRVGAHQRGAPVVLDGAADGGAGRRQRVTLGGHQPLLAVRLAGVDDAGLDAAPQQHAVVRRLAAPAGVERGAVEHDPALAGGQHDGVPLAQRGVVELEALGAHQGP